MTAKKLHSNKKLKLHLTESAKVAEVVHKLSPRPRSEQLRRLLQMAENAPPSDRVVVDAVDMLIVQVRQRQQLCVHRSEVDP